MRRFPFDTALLALNAADIHRLAFVPTALADATQRGMGVIGMKIYAQGALLGPDKLTAAEAMGYVLSLPGVSTMVVGCRTPAEVDDHVRLVRQCAAIDGAHRRQLETRTQRYAAVCTAYKKSA
jgi:predicted aldo/keto reductase-like oxidoreductase